MEVIKIKPHYGEANSFAVTQDDKNCILIDCAHGGIKEEVEALGLKIRGVLLTHGHFDHVGGCGEISEAGVPVFCSEKEKEFIFSAQNRSIFGGVYVPDFKADGVLKDGDTTVGGIKVKVIETAGHTAGSVCFLIGDSLFTGDTLFFESVGRCDLPTGTVKELEKSLKRLSNLDGDYKIYCGHFGETTLGHERKFNPYIKGSRL